MKLKVSAENVTNVGALGHNFSNQYLRLGPEVEGFSFGPAVNLSEVGQKDELLFVPNYGGYFSKQF